MNIIQIPVDDAELSDEDVIFNKNNLIFFISIYF